MKKYYLFVPVLIVFMLIAMALPQSSPAGDKYGGDMGDGKSEKKEYKMAHKGNYLEMMRMLKGTMEIVKNLSHKPTEAEKEKLGEMIKKLDKMMEDMDKMMKEKPDKM